MWNKDQPGQSPRRPKQGRGREPLPGFEKMDACGGKSQEAKEGKLVRDSPRSKMKNQDLKRMFVIKGIV